MFGQLISHPKEEIKKKKQIEGIVRKKERRKRQKWSDRLYLDQQSQLIPASEKGKLKSD